MQEVSFDRICDIGGEPWFCIQTWDRSRLLQTLQTDPEYLAYTTSVSMDTQESIHRIESLPPLESLHLEGVRDLRILSAARDWYRRQGLYSEMLNTFVVPLNARLTIGIHLQDLVYEASPYIDSGGIRSLIAGLNDGIIMRIFPSEGIKELVELYLKQSHSSIRHLARGLGEGWVSTFDRLQVRQPEQVLIQIPPLASPVTHCE